MHQTAAMSGLGASSLAASLLSLVVLGEAARILMVSSFPSFSHQVVFRALSTELARRGHQMVVITPEPINDPTTSLNYTEIDMSTTYPLFRGKNFVSGRQTRQSSYEQFTDLFDIGDHVCETTFSDSQVRAMIDPNNTTEHFDLLIMEWLFTPCMVAFSHRFSAPIIGITSLPPMGILYDSVGNPNNPSYMPDIALPYTDKNRTFLQRLETLIFTLRYSYFFYSTVLPRNDVMIKRFFGPSTPYIEDIHNQVSLLLLTYVEGFHPPRPNVPAIIYVNGLHINPPKRLPEDIQQFLDSAPKGVIYFSLGSNVRCDHLAADKRSMFLEAFAELPDYHVLWKWEADNLPGQPSNVKISKWTPQQDVLRHPKVKVFITQGGMQSLEEAILMKVPMVGIPFFGDQDYMTKVAEDRGVMMSLDVNELTKAKLLETVKKVLEDKSYRENMELLSALVSDQQNSPLERAVWWTEYVLRHKGAHHLRTAAVDMPWYTYLMLDIVLFFIAIATVIVAIFAITVKFIYNQIKLCTSQKEKTN